VAAALEIRRATVAPVVLVFVLLGIEHLHKELFNMSHFAKLDENNVVIRVSVINNSNALNGDGNELESVGVDYINSIHPHEAGQFTWKQTSYNNNFRGNYAGVGMVYMEGVATLGVASTDVFMPPRPSSSWTLNPTTPIWDPPIPRPDHTQEMSDNRQDWRWDEDTYQADNTTGWIMVTGKVLKPEAGSI
jgi:hypothetical protein